MSQTNSLVKLYIYQFENERVLIDTQEAKDFGDFVVISLDSRDVRDPARIEELQNKFTETFPNKRVLIVDQSLDVSFYGFRDVPEIELKNES